MVSIGNNVNVAANVTFATHDVINSILIYMHQKSQKKRPVNGMYLGTIEVGDNVMIGANSTILYNTHIGSNVIVAAGSVVTKDIPSGSIVGGNPAKVIGSFEALLEKRANMNPSTPDNMAGRKLIEDFFWN